MWTSVSRRGSVPMASVSTLMVDIGVSVLLDIISTLMAVTAKVRLSVCLSVCLFLSAVAAKLLL